MRRTARTVVFVFALSFAASGCDDEGESSDPADVIEDVGDAGPDDDTFFPPVNATDPCSEAGFVFEAADCNVVRCPELVCECPDPIDPDDEDLIETVYLSECVPGVGCLATVDCDRVCDDALELDVDACQARVGAAGALSCDEETPCVDGDCRREIVGQLCIEGLPCGENGHCSAGSRCLFDPNARDEETGAPTTTGRCSDGAPGAPCYDPADCRFERCDGGQCGDGAVDSPCESDVQCASDLCRIAEGSEQGQCTEGLRGDTCYEDDDCGSGLGCVNNSCQDGGEGAACLEDIDCDSGVCVSRVCRSGSLGSACSDPLHCTEGICARGKCRSGENGSPCSDDAECGAGFVCGYRECTDGTPGSSCSIDEHCTQAFACLDRVCSDGRDGDRCGNDFDCRSQICLQVTASVERCIVLDAGDSCSIDENCASGVCDPATGTCQ